MRPTLILAATAAAFLIGDSSAKAAPEPILRSTCTAVWEALGTGCAREIAVGPNNVPWILGCPDGKSSNPGPAWVYYLTYTSNGNLIQTPSWVYDGYGSAIDLFVNMNGLPWVSGADGQYHVEAQALNAAKDVVPGSVWITVDDSFPGDMGSTVVAVDYTNEPNVNTGMMFYPQTGVDYNPVYGEETVWSLGCGSACSKGPFNPQSGNPNGNIYSTTVSFNWDEYTGVSGSSTTPWQHLPGAAIQAALFTDPPTSGTLGNGSNTVQNPWVTTTAGQIYYWNASEYTWIQAPLFPNGTQTVRWLTDHYALDMANNVWQWTGASAGGTSSNDWTLVAGLSAGGGGPEMAQIAWSQQASGNYIGQPSTNIGPSQLWGVDIDGNVYSAGTRCAIQ